MREGNCQEGFMTRRLLDLLWISAVIAAVTVLVKRGVARVWPVRLLRPTR